jgi:2-polyprenyl-3-methyl-5-hydroxy-6-metoxy-1,4-benzoquinol methylase
MIQGYSALPLRPRLLDVGCALGFMLGEAKAAGWDPTGLETSPFAAEYAAQQTNCPVISGTLQQANFESGCFDVVTLMDVIEHVAEPRGLMSEIYRILRPGGVLFVITPNFGSLFIKLYGPLAYGVGTEEHVTYFQPSTISHLLRQANFRQVITGSKDLYAANLGRLLGLNRDANIKGAFGNRPSLNKLRGIANRLLMHVKVGDKLIALARK